MLETLIQGGWVMIPLLICSGLAVTIIIERGIFIRQTGKREQADALLALVGEGKVVQARELAGMFRCRWSKC